MHHLEYTRNRVSSAVLLFFWLFVLIVDGVKLRTRIMDHEYETNVNQFGLFTLSYALSFVIFVLENKDRPKSQYIMLDEDEVSNSEKVLYCDFLPITFFYMYSLIHLKRKQTFLVD